MKNDIIELAEDCFREAVLTDELCGASIKTYRRSIRNFCGVIGSKKLEDLSNGDFDRFIIRMKEKGASNCRIANVIAAVKWLIARLKKRGIVLARLNVLDIKKPRVMKKETNYLTEREIRMFLDCIKRDMDKGLTVKNIRLSNPATSNTQSGFIRTASQ